jgi:hypothetical protein
MTDEQASGTVERDDSHDRNRRIAAGATLVIAGLGLLALQAFDDVGDSAVLFFIGTLFLAGYFMRRTYGLLVAACIILGVGLGQVLERVLDVSGDVTVIGIGIGFVAIYAVDRFARGHTQWWPLIPGGILLTIGLSSIGGSFADLLSLIWPALLIVAGVVVLFRANRSGA